MIDYKRVIYKPNDNTELGSIRMVKPDDVFVYTDGTTSKKMSGAEVLKVGAGMVRMPMETRPIQNIYAQGRIIYVIVAEPPSNKVHFDLKNARFEKNFNTNFAFGVFKDYEDDVRIKGNIVIGSFALPYTMEYVSRMYEIGEPHAYNWTLGENLISRVIYEDQTFNGILLKNLEINHKTGIMHGKLQFDVYAKNVSSNPISSSYDFQMNIVNGEFTLKAGNSLHHYKCSAYCCHKLG